MQVVERRMTNRAVQAYCRTRLTQSASHFGIQDIMSREGVESSRSSNSNVWAFRLVAQKFGILPDRGIPIEGGNSNILEVLGETSIFFLDLERQLPGVTEDKDRYFAINGLQLLESGKDEGGSLSVTRLCLAEHIHTENSLGDTFLLN